MLLLTARPALKAGYLRTEGDIMLKRGLFLAVIAALFFSVAAMADTQVSYATQGLFTAGCGAQNGSTSCTQGGVTLSFNGIPTYNTSGTGTTLFAGTGALAGTDWGFPALGVFHASSSSGVTSLQSFTGVSFTLDIWQFVPSTGSNPAAATAELKGGLSYNGSQLVVTFSGTQINWPFDHAAYDLAQPVLGGIQWAVFDKTTINPPDQNSGDTTLQGLAYTAVPEPGSMVLFGTGMTGLAGLIRRRRR
jgi:hypothetical protein